MVYMTHHADYRRTGNQGILRIFHIFQKLLQHVYLFFLFADKVIFQRDLFRCIKINLLVDRYHGSLQEQFFHDSRRLHFHAVSQLLDGHGLGEYQRLDDIFLLLHRLGSRSRLGILILVFVFAKILLAALAAVSLHAVQSVASLRLLIAPVVPAAPFILYPAFFFHGLCVHGRLGNAGHSAALSSSLEASLALGSVPSAALGDGLRLCRRRSCLRLLCPLAPEKTASLTLRSALSLSPDSERFLWELLPGVCPGPEGLAPVPAWEDLPDPWGWEAAVCGRVWAFAASSFFCAFTGSC